MTLPRILRRAWCAIVGHRRETITTVDESAFYSVVVCRRCMPPGGFMLLSDAVEIPRFTSRPAPPS